MFLQEGLLKDLEEFGSCHLPYSRKSLCAAVRNEVFPGKDVTAFFFFFNEHLLRMSKDITNHNKSQREKVLLNYSMKSKSTIVSNTESYHFQFSGLRAVGCVCSTIECPTLSFVS